MKLILSLFVMQAAICAIVSLGIVTSAFQRQAQAGPIIDFLNGGYYYGSGYGSYPLYGQGPYAYGTYRGNGYQSYGAGPYGYGTANYGTPTYGQYRHSYYGPNGTMTYHGGYGYGAYNTGN